MTEDQQTLHVARDGSVARVTLDNPPVNVLGANLMTDLTTFLHKGRADDRLKVIVFDSANPDFFIAHVDMTLMD